MGNHSVKSSLKKKSDPMIDGFEMKIPGSSGRYNYLYKNVGYSVNILDFGWDVCEETHIKNKKRYEYINVHIYDPPNSLNTNKKYYKTAVFRRRKIQKD